MGAKIGHIVSEATREKLRIFNIGKKASEETKRKMSETKKIKGVWNKGKTGFKGYWTGKKRPPMKESTKKLLSERWKGSNNINWRGGVSYGYGISRSAWDKIRKQVYVRDNHTCQICGIQYRDEKGYSVEAHHIVPYRIGKDNSICNLITLCKRCHTKEEKKYYNSIGK